MCMKNLTCKSKQEKGQLNSINISGTISGTPSLYPAIFYNATKIHNSIQSMCKTVFTYLYWQRR